MVKNRPRNRRDNTLTCTRKRGRQAIHREPSCDRPPPGTIMCTCGWWVRAPGMEHRDDADACTQVLGIGSDRERGLGRRLHEQIVDHPFVLIGDAAELGWPRVDDMEIADREERGFAFGEPLPCGRGLTLRAMPIAATVIGDDSVSARVVLATRNVAAQRRGAAALDRRHHLQLMEADVPAIGLTP